MKKFSLVLVLAMAMVMVFSMTAFAAQNIDPTTHLTLETPKNTTSAYPDGIYLSGTTFGDYPNLPGLNETPGLENNNIHSDYNRNTDACASCHATHTAVGEALLQWADIGATCDACHDGTIAETYNVAGGYISGIAGTRTMGGLFAGTASASQHVTDGTYDLAAAPGGNTMVKGQLTNQVWNATFECTSCHEPHGNADNYRILRPDVADKGATQYTEAIPVGTTTFTALNKGTWLLGRGKGYYVYTSKSYDAVAKKWNYTNVDPLTTPFTVDVIKGTVTFAAPTTIAISVDYTPGIRVDGTVTNKLQATEVAKYGAGMNAFCGACHTDYDTTVVKAFTAGSTTVWDSKAVPPQYVTISWNAGDVPVDSHGKAVASSSVASGTYTGAMRHKVGRDYSGAATHKDMTFGTDFYAMNDDKVTFKLDANGNKIPSGFNCLTCHVAHGVDEGWWTDWSTGQVGNVSSEWKGTVSAETAGSSALKRLPNMSTCESCHAKGVNNLNY